MRYRSEVPVLITPGTHVPTTADTWNTHATEAWNTATSTHTLFGSSVPVFSLSWSVRFGGRCLVSPDTWSYPVEGPMSEQCQVCVLRVNYHSVMVKGAQGIASVRSRLVQVC